MTSYQRLKAKCEELERQIEWVKGALIVATKFEQPEFDPKNNTLEYQLAYLVEASKRELDYEVKRKLCEWVATNLDKEYVMELLELKEWLKKCATK